MFYSGLIQDIKGQTEKAFYDLSLVTKNINNLNTFGYKAERPMQFGEILTDQAPELSEKSQKLLQPGKLSITQNPKDISLEGQGFFALQDENGDTVLSRNLTLSANKDGFLSSGKYLISPKIKVNSAFQGFFIELDGTIKGIDSDGLKTKLGSLRVVNYPASDKLNFNGLVYSPKEEAGKAFPVCLGQDAQTKVRQGTLESSNVDIPLEMYRFTDANKKITTLARIVQLMTSSEREYIRSNTSAIG